MKLWFVSNDVAHQDRQFALVRASSAAQAKKLAGFTVAEVEELVPTGEDGVLWTHTDSFDGE